MKVFELEFDDGVSLKEIKAELDYYRSVGDVVRTKINGEMVYSNDENYEETNTAMLVFYKHYHMGNFGEMDHPFCV